MRKRSFLIPILFLLSLSLVGCQNDYQKQLRLMIEGHNSECPIPLGVIGHMDKASYNGDIVTFSYTLTGVFDNKTFNENSDEFHQYMLNNYRSNSDESFRQLLKAIVEAKAELDVVFTIVDGESHTLHFTNQELADNLPSYISDPEAFLQSALQSTQLQLPLTYSEGMICTAIDMDSNYYTYYFECDESLFDINEMQQSAEENHEAVKQMLTTSNDPSFIKLMQMLNATHRGLRYLYTGTTSGKKAIVTISSDEL